MAKLIEMLKYNDGRISIARISTVITFALWIFTWLYTLFLGKTYAHFETVTIAMLILFFVVLLNKAVTSRIVSIGGENNERNRRIGEQRQC